MEKPYVDEVLDTKTEELAEAIEQEMDNHDKDKARLKRRNNILHVIILVLLIVIIIILLRGCDNRVQFFTPQDIEDSEYIETYKESQIKEVSVYAFDDEITLTDDNPYITLANPVLNADKYNLVFEIYDCDIEEPIYESKLVQTGSDAEYKFSVNLAELLEQGTHEITIYTRAFRVSDNQEVNGAVQTIIVNRS